MKHTSAATARIEKPSATGFLNLALAKKYLNPKSYKKKGLMELALDDFKDKLSDLQDYFNNLDKNQQIAYLCILVGVILIAIAFILW
jgi:hypothetical protein